MSGGLHVRVMGEPPVPPPDADFAFEIDFEKGAGNPRRVFDAASLLIDAFEILDTALASTFDSELKPLLVVEDVEAGSIKVWLRNILTRTDDSALKTLDWRPLIGRYLVRAKYLTLEYLDRADDGQPPSIEDLRQGLRQLAEETDVRQLPDYPPVHEARLVTALDRIQSAKRTLDKKDRLTIEADGNVYEVDLTQTWQPSEVIAVSASAETKST